MITEFAILPFYLIRIDIFLYHCLGESLPNRLWVITKTSMTIYYPVAYDIITAPSSSLLTSQMNLFMSQVFAFYTVIMNTDFENIKKTKKIKSVFKSVKANT